MWVGSADRRGSTVRGAFLMLLALGWPGGARAVPERAPDVDPWVGSQVVLKSLATPLRNGKEVVDIQYRYQRYRVEKADREAILISCGLFSGWVERAQAVPFHRAIDYFTGQIQRNPLSIESYNMRGLVWRDKRKPEKAVEDFTHAIGLSPNSAWIYSNRGIAFSELKRYDEALADYDQALRLSPTYLSAYNNRGLVWAAKKEYDKAIADYTEAIRLDPQHVLPYTNRAQAYRLKKEYDQALADCDAALRLSPKNPLAFSNRGLVHAARKEYERALADYDEAVRVDPQQPQGHNNRAWLLATCPDARIRDGLKAIAAATRACELSAWRSAMTLDTLAAAHAEAGDFGAALKWQARALELLPQDSPIADGYRERRVLYEGLKPYREEKQED